MIRRLRYFLEMIRFSHTLFALPFALLAALMAWKANSRQEPAIEFQWKQLVGILLCMVFARSAAMTFNRIVDRRVDAVNPRTANRHLPQGLLGVGLATAFASACSVCFVASTLLFLPQNPLPLYGSIPVLLFLFGYSFAKRFTALAHFWLGAALMLAPVAAWAAIRAEIGVAPTLLGAAVLLWVAGFDVIYACQDYDFDVRANLRSLPARFGVSGALKIAAACHALMLAPLVVLPWFYPFFGTIYYCGIAAIAALLIYEHALVRPDDLSRVNRAFFHVNAVVSVGLLVVGALDLFWR